MCEPNGLFLSNYRFPSEIIITILSHVPPADILRTSLVCKEWNKIIKSTSFWLKIFERKYPKRKAKQLPWYVYYVLLATQFFDCDFLKKYDTQLKSFQLSVKSESSSEFYKGPFTNFKRPRPRCFGPKFYFFHLINLNPREVYLQILREYKPHIIINQIFGDCVTEPLKVQISGREIGEDKLKTYKVCECAKCKKETFIIDNYPEDIEQIYVWQNYVHEDPLYNIKFSQSSLIISFDSIKESI